MAVAAAGTLKRVDQGWAIIMMQAISKLALAMGVVSFGLYYQPRTGGTFLHRLTSSPADATLVYRTWLTFCELIPLNGFGR